jgi:ferredoxin
MVFSVFVDTEKCKGCGDCVASCYQLHALELVPVQDLWLETLHFELFKNLPQYSRGMKVA